MAKKATYIQAKVSGGSTVESFEIVDKGARGDVYSLSSRVSTLENAPAPQDGKSISVKSATKSNGVTTVVLTDGTTDTTLTINDGTDGTSVSVKSSTKSNGVTTVVLTDGTTDATLTINDGITPTITPNSGNTVTYNSTSGQYELASGASSHVYKLNITAGSSTITTPNLLFGTDAILEAIDAIINESPTVTVISGE